MIFWTDPRHGRPYACPVDIELISGPHKGYVATICGGSEGLEGAGAVLDLTNAEEWTYMIDWAWRPAWQAVPCWGGILRPANPGAGYIEASGA